MSRNRCRSKCDCGRRLTLDDTTTRPMTFSRYLKVIGRKDSQYESEYFDLIVCQAICPECGTKYALWLNGKTNIHPFDTSYWHAFNDEPSRADVVLPHHYFPEAE